MEKAMREKIGSSPHIIKARHLIESAKNHSLSVKERGEKAVELTASLLQEADRVQTRKEKSIQNELSRMMEDPMGKVFTTYMTDQCFRTSKTARTADQMVYLLRELGTPRYVSFSKKIQLALFKALGKPFSFLFVPAAVLALRQQTKSVILPGEAGPLAEHMKKRKAEGVRLNINHLGEAILGEEEAQKRLQLYLDDLANPDFAYMSIKLSTIYSQINLLAREKTLSIAAERLRALYRAANRNTYTYSDGTVSPKFINLDMEEYRDLELTKDLFKMVLSEPEFEKTHAGIVLQAYLPDSFIFQKELTEWAKERVKRGGAPIKIRLVKGANLAMEQFEASLRGWAQAPYKEKIESDANFKRMLTYGCQKENAKAAHIGVGSHNLFDISYALLLRAENGSEKEISFEMLEGMAEHIRRVVQEIAGTILLYCPVAKKEDFQNAIAYLIRRLDENTGAENFLRHVFGLKPGSTVWKEQRDFFLKSCQMIDTTPVGPRRKQNRAAPIPKHPLDAPFQNEPDTDFSLPANRDWALSQLHAAKGKSYGPIPNVIGGKEFYEQNPSGKGIDPSYPDKELYRYSKASWEEVDQALEIAVSSIDRWKNTPARQRAEILANVAHKLRENLGYLFGIQLADGGKTIFESDPEISETIDFADYYARSLLEMESHKDISWQPKGVILVAPPWNFPVSIPCGGILAAIASGNTVIFKPAPEAVLSGWALVNILWDAGVPKEVVQFINCEDETVGSELIKDQRVRSVILTGATSTAQKFLSMRPDLDLSAETGGKNSLIITSLADRDLAIKDLLQSAFGHSGQKCSAASLAIVEAEVYDDPHFMNTLKAACESLTVGSAWDPASKVVPMVRAPEGALLKAFKTLEPGERWLVEPKPHPQNPHLWSPGIKIGVRPGSFMHLTELFGPALGIIRAKNLDHAIALANATPYGLTSGIHSLDKREREKWVERIQAGNLYINRTITGAIVRRQPFGGCKASSFGRGSKAGGPNYLAQFAVACQVSLPKEKATPCLEVNHLNSYVSSLKLSPPEQTKWKASIENYAYWAEKFLEQSDLSKVVGQDNFLIYRPRKKMCIRVRANDSPLDVLLVIAAALSVKTHIEVSWEKDSSPFRSDDKWTDFLSFLPHCCETEESFLHRVRMGTFRRLRLLTFASPQLCQAAHGAMCHLHQGAVLSNGCFELPHYLREIALSVDYHRYGNLGEREKEAREPIL